MKIILLWFSIILETNKKIIATSFQNNNKGSAEAKQEALYVKHCLQNTETNGKQAPRKK